MCVVLCTHCTVSERVSEWVRACMCLYVFTGVYFVLWSPSHIRACNEHTPANVCEWVCVCMCVCYVVEYCTHIAKSPIIKYHGVIAVVVVVVLIVVIVIVIVVGPSCFNHHSFPVSAIFTHTHSNANFFYSFHSISSVPSSSSSSFFFSSSKREHISFIPFSAARFLLYSHTQYIACIIICACTVHTHT